MQKGIRVSFPRLNCSNVLSFLGAINEVRVQQAKDITCSVKRKLNFDPIYIESKQPKITPIPSNTNQKGLGVILGAKNFEFFPIFSTSSCVSNVSDIREFNIYSHSHKLYVHPLKGIFHCYTRILFQQPNLLLLPL